MSAISLLSPLPSVRLVSAMCPPLCPPHLRLVSALSLLGPLQILSALCAPLLSALRVPICPPCQLRSNMCLASRLCPLVTCCGAGPWHHEAKNFFLSIAQPLPRLYCMPVCQFPLSILASKFGLCKGTLLEKLFGVYAGAIWSLRTEFRCRICIRTKTLRAFEKT